MWSPSPMLTLELILLFSILWTRHRGAPWVPTPMSKVHKMLTMAEVGPDDVVYDLGCGDGRMIVTAARRYGSRAVGIELDPLRYLWCQILITVLRLRGRIRILYGHFFTKDLSAASVVTCYLMQSTNEKLQGKLKRELHPSTRVISSDFTFPELRLLQRDETEHIGLYSPVV